MKKNNSKFLNQYYLPLFQNNFTFKIHAFFQVSSNYYLKYPFYLLMLLTSINIYRLQINVYFIII